MNTSRILFFFDHYVAWDTAWGHTSFFTIHTLSFYHSVYVSILCIMNIGGEVYNFQYNCVLYIMKTL